MSLKLIATCLKTLQILKAIGWLCVRLLVWLSWIPADLDMRTGMAGQIQHAIAYCGTGAISRSVTKNRVVGGSQPALLCSPAS